MLAVAMVAQWKSPPMKPADTRVALRAEAYHYCEFRLVASLPKDTDLNVRALRRGRRSSTEVSIDLFRVVGYFDGRVFGAETHGEYQCVVRRSQGTTYELIQLRMHREPQYPHK
jgi:hypothetical protein